MSYFSINTKIFFGKNSTDDVITCFDSMKLKKIQFIVDASLKDSDVLHTLIDQYMRYDKELITPAYIKAVTEPTYDYLDSLVDNFRGVDFDVIIGIGGGTILDIAKGVGILVKNPGKAIDYRGMDQVTNPGVPVICYPSTAGTGSEVTHTASFIDTSSQTKLGINGRYVAPLCGVLYPELTFSCPHRVTIGSGLDAMVHAVEAVTARTATSISSMFGCQAFSMLYGSFPLVLSEPHNYVAREKMLMGSYYAGIAMMNAGGGPASGISYPLGVHYGVPHGIAGGIFLPHVFEYNIRNGYLGYENIYDRLSGAVCDLSVREKSAEFLNKINLLYESIGAPRKLRDWGWNDIDPDKLTGLTMKQRKANLDLNPVDFGEEQTSALIHKVF
jgi:alcohol dehydrogenase